MSVVLFTNNPLLKSYLPDNPWPVFARAGLKVAQAVAAAEQAAQKLNISQSSVSQRLKRANYDLILETDKYFRKKISQL